MQVIVHEALKDKVRVGVMVASGITYSDESDAAIFNHIAATSARLQAAHAGETVGQVDGVASARKLYRSIGIDPTKTRPSSEALLRRVLKGKSLYRVHPLVDLFNLVSLERLTPIGLYDLRRIEGETVTVRIGREGEGYDGIRKGRVNLSGRFLVSDSAGPFGSPTSDSLRTAIEGDVGDALVLFFQHADIDRAAFEETLDLAEALLCRHLGAQIRVKTIIDR